MKGYINAGIQKFSEKILRSHLLIPGARWVTRSKFHTEDPKIAIWLPAVVPPCLRLYLYITVQAVSELRKGYVAEIFTEPKIT